MKYLPLGCTPAVVWDAATAGTPSEEAPAASVACRKSEQELIATGEPAGGEGFTA
ncbi:hypothetical protein [Streptosporangium pseudovulgare]|uniref:Uncharacterized protein n=1 Tax=Streptosporangium pseudovulgare TaxID=35765 RepID=A0ABQ2R8G3_9ACTN|nr:hypothetical protein [Streptosporangium pseudovulgare]GGQ19132.1 hypothetical protein GCM10010140_56790 [Streptosporangium pseudovulgare]